MWSATNVRTIDITRGPQGPFAFPPGETVTCEFTPKSHGKGSTPKFECALPSGRALKVRYGNDNGEVYAQVAATRLLWTLGFAATRMYPVKLVCRGCPPHPFKDRTAAPRSTVTTFDPATIEVKADGETIETKPGEGWSWDELDLIDRISEGGRKFLADLLNQLSDAQIRDLFGVARFTQRDPSASLADWINAFKAKREAIATRTCP